ncbi:hypothetical protein [Bradyrhizobium sp. HKCCYLR1023]|uniref:hypothetical protein n=1 Tax=Bradyrhizobium TaxID=374 RepID=UPI003EBA8102
MTASRKRIDPDQRPGAAPEQTHLQPVAAQAGHGGNAIMGNAMRRYLLAFTLVIAALGFTSSARAGCWPNENFHLVCWLDTYGTACEAHHALTSVRAVLYPEPRYSYYEFEVSHWWTAHKTVACPPNQKTTFSGVWDRETGKAEETATTGISSVTRRVYCSNNPWTGQGPPTVPICSYPADDPNVGLPVTSAMLTQSQRDDLLRVQEPSHTRCQQIKPLEDEVSWLNGRPIVEVVASHHEYQKLEWHLWFMDFGEFGPWHEVAAPKPKGPLIWKGTTYTERRIATSRHRYWLNKPGRWKVVAKPKPTAAAAQAIPISVTTECPGATFNVQ